MALNGMICNLHIDSVDDAEYDFGHVAAYDFADDAGFDLNTLPARCPSGSISGSSYASSSFGPHTPTSGRSTPPFSTSFDFGSSFGSSVDSGPFGLTPPSSATSTYFPMTPNTGHVVSDFGNPVFPVTPSRGQFEFPSHPLSSCGPHLTPSQSMDCNFLINQLGPLPVLSTPSAVAQFNRFSDVASHWAYPDSPISFDQQQASTAALAGSFQAIKQEPESDTMTSSVLSLHTTARRRALMGEARRRTTVLQQEVQKGSPPTRRTTRIKREKKACAAAPENDHSYAVDSIEPASAFKCLAEGCPKVYRRNEHMKRHMKT